MNALFAVEAHASAVGALPLKGLYAGGAGVAGADKVGDRLEAMCARMGDNGGAGIEEFGEGWGACDGEVEGEVFSGKDETREVRGGRANGGEGGYC